jgi:subtilase family serine protease
VRRLSVLLFAIFAIMLGTTMVSRSQAQSLPLLTRHVRQETLNGQAPLVGHLPSTQSMRLTLVLPHRNQAALNQFLKDLYDPSSASYRRFLTVDEFTANFGPTQEDYDSVVLFAKANGFTVVGTSRNRMNIDVTGAVENIESAFHVTMGTYQHPTENRTFFAPDREPTPDLAVQLWHIAGLDNYSTPHPALVRRDQNVKSALASPNQGVKPNATTGSGPSASFLGSDMRAAYYGGTALTGSGQSIGLFEFIGTDLTDLATYFTNAGQTNSVPITLLSVDTQSTSCVEPTCDDTEQTIDMIYSLGMAPGLSSLVMYIGTGALTGQTIDDAGILNAMATANPLNAQLSCSWSWTPADPSTDDPFFQEFAAQGQNFFADAGDDGNWATAPFVWPADSAFVTTVGGTSLQTTGAGGTWSSETGWDDTGGGISPNQIAIPAWQVATAAGCANCSQAFRNGPDVSANADFTYFVCADQEACTANLFGGTTFSTPIWAGYMALVNQQAAINGKPPLGFINPALYTIGLGPDYGLDFHDITTGGNTLGTTVGYDLSTGWGSPNGSALIEALAGSANPAVATTLSYNGPATFTNGSAGNPSATLTQTTGGAAVSGASVLFTLGTGGTAQTCSGTTGTNGVATCTIASVSQTAGGGAISASFAGNSNFLTSSSGPIAVNIVAGSAVATTLVYNGPATFTNGSAGNPSAMLTQTTGGAAVPGVSVLFTLGTGGTAQTCTGTTGANGTATCTITSVNQTAGGDTISASFAGNSSFLTSSAGPVSVTISAAPAVATTLTYNGPATFTNGSAGNPSATLTQTTGGAAVPGVSVLFTLGGGVSSQTCSGTTGSNGVATCTITSVNQTAGADTISASFAGNSSFLTSSAGPVSITISAASAIATTLAYNGPTTFTNGSAANPSATLTQTTGGSAVPGVSVLFTLGTGGAAQTCTGTTGTNGTATCAITSANQTVGADTVSASFAGNSGFLTSSAGPLSVTISAVPAVATTLTYNGPTTFTNGSAANPSATLTQTTGGSAVPGVSILFTLGSGGTAQTCSGTTGTNGAATCTITSVNQTGGADTISASFAGNSSFLTSSAGPVSVTISVAPAVATTLTYNGPTTFANGSAGNPSATLTQTTGGAAVPGVSVLFTLGTGGTAQTCSGTTGTNGAASCSITSVNQTAGGDTISASFAGNSSFLASAAGSVSVTITDFTLTVPTGTVTLTPGQTATYTITTGSFPGPVTLTASGLPTGAVATFNPNPVVPPETSTTLTITTTAPSAGVVWKPFGPRGPSSPRSFPAWTILLALSLAGMSFACLKRRTLRRMAPLTAMILLIAAASYLTGCTAGFPGLGTSNATPAGTFSIKVTATSGTDVHTTTVTLIVQ